MKSIKVWIIAGISLAVLLTGVIVISLSRKHNPVTDETTDTTEITESESNIVPESETEPESESGQELDIPEVTEDTGREQETEGSSEADTVSKDNIDPDKIVKPDENEGESTEETETVASEKESQEESEAKTSEKTSEKSSETTKSNTKNTKEKTTVVEPEEEEEPDSEPTETGSPQVVIGGDEDSEEYDCGVKNHHCEGPETHAYISNLELEGCPYCGSHSCASFYGTDEWGNAQYTPSLCPKYSVKKDPLNYCQTCGKPTGDGTDGTCVRYIQECDCPNCGEHVESLTCHTCN